MADIATNVDQTDGWSTAAAVPVGTREILVSAVDDVAVAAPATRGCWLRLADQQGAQWVAFFAAGAVGRVPLGGRSSAQSWTYQVRAATGETSDVSVLFG